MVETFLPQFLLLLAAIVACVVLFQRLRIPSILGYLLVGVLLGAYTPGPIIDAQPVRALAEFGIVFLLFTIGLNFSIPQIRALRSLLLRVGTGQVVLTTLVVGLLAWAVGLPPAAAFVVGAVFAQSSTAIISRQLNEQREENSRHGRLGIAMSVFQDVTAVPFLVIIPVLAVGNGVGELTGALGMALVMAALAFAVVVLAGRWVLRPLFYLVANLRSTEVFTLTVLLVSLAAAWVTTELGLSMAFGAFLAGMMLGDTEFRHQVESTIRPFRDVLLGLFFVGIGMLLNPAVLPDVWAWALGGAVALLVIKGSLVAAIVRRAGVDPLTAWRTGWLLAIGGEFGFALLAIALRAGVLDVQVGQAVLASVMLAMIVAPFIIRSNEALARLGTRLSRTGGTEPRSEAGLEAVRRLHQHAIICGYGRIGQGVAHFLEEEGIPFVALDLDPARVREAELAGERVFYGDASERDLLHAMGLEEARLVVISHANVASALKTLHHVRTECPELPVMVRTHDERHVEELRKAGATEVVPETLEAALMIAAHALALSEVPLSRVLRRVRTQRAERYRLLREVFPGEASVAEPQDERLRPVVIAPDSPAVDLPLGKLALSHVTVAALVREGRRTLAPSPSTTLQPGDVVVLFGSPEDLDRAEQRL